MTRRSRADFHGLVFFFAVVLLLAGNVNARTIYVDDDPGGGNFTRIQDAINVAIGGVSDPPEKRDVVVVRDGTYRGSGNRDINFMGKAITVISENGPTTTIIDCEKLGRAFKFSSKETNLSVLSGFTIINGNTEYGGAIYCSSSPTISNCIMKNNYVLVGGAAIYSSPSSAPVIENCTISSNKSGNYAGGIYVYYASATLKNCTISKNIAMNRDGGGIYATSSTVKMTNCTLSENSATSGGGAYSAVSQFFADGSTFAGNKALRTGGAIFLSESGGAITNCRINANTAIENGGGISHGGASTGTSMSIGNCNISGNKSFSGGGMHLSSKGKIAVTNCTLEQNSAGRAYDGTGGGGAGGGGIYCFYANSLTIEASSFLNNSTIVGYAYQGGAGIYSMNSSPRLTNCVFSGNRATLATPHMATSSAPGGALYASGGSPSILNCTIANNYGENNAGGISSVASSLAVKNTILWGNLPTEIIKSDGVVLSTSNVKGGWLGAGEHNMDIDPEFVNEANADFHLKASSPCIDSGTDDGAPKTDKDGLARPQDGDRDGFAVTDLGAYEFVNRNRPPVANAGENATISSEMVSSSNILGVAFDEDEGDVLLYRWKEGDVVLLDWTPATPEGDCMLPLGSIWLGIGAHTLTLEVTDGDATAQDDMILTLGNSAPHAAAGGGGTYQIGTTVLLVANVSDFDGDLLTYEWKESDLVLCSGTAATSKGGNYAWLPPCEATGLGLGTHLISLEVSDGVNKPVSSEVTVKIEDSQAPTLAPLASQNMLWPPNHKMVDIVVEANASDNSGLPVRLAAWITSNEPADGIGDGNHEPDWTEPVIDQQTGTISFKLRAERSGTGAGREYVVTISAVDQAGNSSTTSLMILVPHDKGK